MAVLISCGRAQCQNVWAYFRRNSASNTVLLLLFSFFFGTIVLPIGSAAGCLFSAMCQVDREEREWCAGLPAEIFWPWVERLKELEHSPEVPPPNVW